MRPAWKPVLCWSIRRADDIDAAMRPKVDGTLTLHEVFPPEQLDWMVLFSSCGYLAGFPGQGAYACANSFLDVMARHRRGLGDRTVSVAWTAWRGLGMGSTSGFVAAQLDALGMGTIGADEAMRALDLAMRTTIANVVVLPVLPAAAAVPMLADVAPAETDESEPANRRSAISSARRRRGPGAVAGGCIDGGGGATGPVRTATSIPALPLVEIGVDSIMTVGLLRATGEADRSVAAADAAVGVSDRGGRVTTRHRRTAHGGRDVRRQPEKVGVLTARRVRSTRAARRPSSCPPCRPRSWAASASARARRAANVRTRRVRRETG